MRIKIAFIRNEIPSNVERGVSFSFSRFPSSPLVVSVTNLPIIAALHGCKDTPDYDLY